MFFQKKKEISLKKLNHHLRGDLENSKLIGISKKFNLLDREKKKTMCKEKILNLQLTSSLRSTVD